MTHPSLGPVLAVGLLIGACAGDAERPDARAPGTSAAIEPEVPAGAPDATPTTSRSPLADRVRELDSARYDPAAQRDQRPRPVALRIRSLGIDDAPVLSVGVEPNGDMEIPAPEEIGWYRFGAAPGDPGTTVLAAHIAFDGVDGVFRRLADAEIGAEVAVVLDDSTVRTYVVRSVEEYGKRDLPEELWAIDGPERLALITCGGEFNRSLRSYEGNVIAWAEPVRPDG